MSKKQKISLSWTSNRLRDTCDVHLVGTGPLFFTNIYQPLLTVNTYLFLRIFVFSLLCSSSFFVYSTLVELDGQSRFPLMVNRRVFGLVRVRFDSDRFARINSKTVEFITMLYANRTFNIAIRKCRKMLLK